MFIPRLTECAWPYLGVSLILIHVLAWSWHLKFQTLTIENLVIIESGWCSVKSYSFASICFIVRRSSLSCPFLWFSYIRDNTAWPNSSWIIGDVHGWTRFILVMVMTACRSCSFLLLCFKNPNLWVLSIYLREPISSGLEKYTLCVRSIIQIIVIDNSWSSLSGLIILLQVIKFLIWLVMVVTHCVILLYLKHTTKESILGWAKCTILNSISLSKSSIAWEFQ